MARSAYAFHAENANTLDCLDSTAFAAASGSANYIQDTTSYEFVGGEFQRYRDRHYRNAAYSGLACEIDGRYNGYLYIIGGTPGGVYLNDNIQYCPINANGSVGSCTQQTNAFTTARYGHTSVSYNGYLYVIGGWSGSAYLSDIQHIPLKTIADTARYERFFDTGSAANNLNSFTLQGSTACAYTVTYKTAGSDGVWGSSTTMLNVVPGESQTLNVNSQRYVFVTATLDDSTCGGASTISSMALAYNGAPDAPTLVLPAASALNVNTLPDFSLGSADDSNDYLRYKIEVCSTSDCSVVVRTIDQTSSQTGWTSQSLQSGTAYPGGATLTQLAIHRYQPSPLATGTQFWWRAQAIDPGGTID